MHRANVGMTRSRQLLLLLLSLTTAGCTQLVAVTSENGDLLPAKTPEQPADVVSEPDEVQEIAGGEIEEGIYPPVLLSKFHAQWCTRQVGEKFPEVELNQLGGRKQQLATLFGKQATVVVFWHDDRWMSNMALEGVQQDVVDKFDAAEIAVVGIPVQLSTNRARRQLKQARADFPQLMDSKGKTLAEVGSVALPRLYVLDPAGTIVWFDIEYSASTRRELVLTLELLTGNQP